MEKLSQNLRNPVLQFDSVTGTDWSVVTNVCASLSRIARSIGISTRDLEERLEAMYHSPISPHSVDNSEAPVRDVVLSGEEVDLSLLPDTRHSAVEQSPYVTGAAVVAWDHQQENLNVSYHRMMVVDSKTLAIYMVEGGHLDRIVRENATRLESTPVAAFVGAHPIWSLGVLAGGGREVDELSMIGSLLDAPLQVTPSLVDERILVPARAELCLEGMINAEELVDEGPYGEFAGYAMAVSKRPRFDVQYMSHRKKPLYQEIIAGHLEHLTMTGATILADLNRKLTAEFDGVLEVHIPAAMTLFVRVDTAVMAQADVQRLIEHVLEKETYVKQVSCFDRDIDLKKLQSTQWALATRVQADRDFTLVSGVAGTGMDPSEINGTTTKLGINATAKPSLEAFAEKNSIPQDVLDTTDLKKLFE